MGLDKTPIKVDKFTLEGKFIQSYNSLKQAALLNGVHQGNLSRLLKGRCHTLGGYIWKEHIRGIK